MFFVKLSAEQSSGSETNASRKVEKPLTSQSVYLHLRRRKPKAAYSATKNIIKNSKWRTWVWINACTKKWVTTVLLQSYYLQNKAQSLKTKPDSLWKWSRPSIAAKTIRLLIETYIDVDLCDDLNRSVQTCMQKIQIVHLETIVWFW